MGKRDFLSRPRFIRNAIRDDLLYFGLPAILVYIAGLLFSARGFVELENTLEILVRYPRSLFQLSGQNILGVALFIIGLTIMLIAHINLGRFYSSTLVIRKDHQLITHGVYRFTRHPIYLGVIMACIGMPVFASSLVGLLTMSALIPIFLIRIKLEERMLIEEFGDAYRVYKETTSKLIPFIY